MRAGGTSGAAARALAMVLGLFGYGCGLGAQTMLGWNHEEELARQMKRHTVRVATSHSGAEVVRRNPDGKEDYLGIAPITDTIDYEMESVRRTPKYAGLLGGGAVTLGGSVAAFLLGRGKKSCFAPDDCFETSSPNKLAFGIAGALLYLGLQDLVVAWVHGASDEEVEERPVAQPERTYVARKPGYMDALGVAQIPVTDGLDLNLSLDTTIDEGREAQAKVRQQQWVVAVMDVASRPSADDPREVDETLVRNLEDQLRVFVGQAGYRTIDRGSQDQTLRDQILAVKADSYKNCYDESCQIELGRALAATHILRSRITRFGPACVLNSELIDLRTEVAVAAAASKGACEAEAFLGMSEEVAEKLLRR